MPKAAAVAAPTPVPELPPQGSDVSTSAPPRAKAAPAPHHHEIQSTTVSVLFPCNYTAAWKQQ